MCFVLTVKPVEDVLRDHQLNATLPHWRERERERERDNNLSKNTSNRHIAEMYLRYQDIPALD